jgi:hypothetical protein
MTSTDINAPIELASKQKTGSVPSGISVVASRSEVPVKEENNSISALGSRKRNTKSLEQLQDIAETLRRKEDLSLDEKSRKMSIIYSRRKRIKHKMRLNSLEKEHALLAAENERVRRENAKLEALLERSMTLVVVSERAKLAATVRLLEQQQLMASLATPKVLALPRPVLGEPLALNFLASSSFRATNFRSTLQDLRTCSLLSHPGESDFLVPSML